MKAYADLDGFRMTKVLLRIPGGGIPDPAAVEITGERAFLFDGSDLAWF